MSSSSSSERLGSEEERVGVLMAEGFGDPLPRQARNNELVVAEQTAEVPVGIPVRPPRSATLGFALGTCKLTQAQAEAFAQKFHIDPNTYRIFVVPEAGAMSLNHIPLPLAHFDVGLRLPMDPAFVDFLVFACVQPGRIHPNAVRILFSLICLCRRLGCEFSMNILRTFYSSLRMSDSNLSLRPLQNKVRLFDSPPNKVNFRGKWVMVESKIGFPFRPRVDENYEWSESGFVLSQTDKKFMEAVERDLGSSRRGQARTYSMADLLSEESLRWCGIGGGLEDRRLELGFRAETPNPQWIIHPGGVFAPQCVRCNSAERGCRAGQGNCLEV